MSEFLIYGSNEYLSVLTDTDAGLQIGDEVTLKVTGKVMEMKTDVNMFYACTGSSPDALDALGKRRIARVQIGYLERIPK